MQTVTESSDALLARMAGVTPGPAATLVTGPGAAFWELDLVEHRFRHTHEFTSLLGIGECSGGVTVRQFCDAVSDDDRAAVEARLGVAIAGAEGLSLHFRMAGSGTPDTTVALYGQAVHQAQGVSRLVGFLFKVEDVGYAEVAALRAADRHKNEFIATMAHELRNPLTAILCASELIGRTAPADGPLAAAAAAVRRQVAHMIDLIDDMRCIGFPGVAQSTPAKRLCRFDEVVRNACEQSMPLMGARAHRFVAESETGGALVNGNFTQLVQIVSNLLNNAAKFTPDGGTIRLHTSIQGDRLHCEISDTGVGMAPEFIGKAFDAFVQANGHRQVKDAGVGLGLKLVREFAAIHGGSVVARSDGCGRGSTFELELPLASSP